MVGRELRRKAYDKLLLWKKRSKGQTAILVEGARRVGKSFLVEKFAREQYRSYILIDFSHVADLTLEVFKQDSWNLDLFFAKISAQFNTMLYPRESVIVFDEVQDFPSARQLIKHLVADGRFDYIETGSLIRIKKNVKNITIPSEEEKLKMYPLDFEEFLWAMGDEASYPYICEHFERSEPLGQAMHGIIMQKFREYLIVGGMPQSVLAYGEHKDFEASDVAKRNILNLYHDDMNKFAEGYEQKAIEAFDAIPSQLSRREKRFRLSVIDKDARFRTYADAFIWLGEAMIVNRCYNVTDPSIAISICTDRSQQKCYMADTGLLITHAFEGDNLLDNEFYKAVLFDRLNINEGMITENVVAQMLVSHGHDLHYYSHQDSANRENHMEIDFLISKQMGTYKKILPIEVKSGNYRRHASLDKFMKKYKKEVCNPVIFYTKDVTVKDGITHLPLYMAELL